jgi:hypothetical protein
MITSKENLEKIIKHIEKEAELTEKESLKSRLKKVNTTVIQNQNKIWLRTKKGKPLAEALEDATKHTLNLLEKGSPDAILASVEEIEKQAIKIIEESRRRSMVVT